MNRISVIALVLTALSFISCDRNEPQNEIPTDTITITADTPWVVAPDEEEAVQRALQDVQRDWYKVFGHRPLILTKPPVEYDGPVIYLGSKGAWLGQMLAEPLSGRETFVLRLHADAAQRPALVATGSDVRGTIYAAYTLSEEILGVDPWYFWTDHEPERRKKIEIPADLDRQFGPATFTYRGWFINDEDLLSRFSSDPLQENVFSLAMLDRICETLLRVRGNMIVPGTFNFPDERCWELAARRGLALNMHHILVVGLNTYRWPEDVPFSYNRHPDIMENYWRQCIDALKDYEVVWTVGYRGKHDQPFWVDEPQLTTPEARGAVITNAIAKQVELIREVDPEGMIIANLWMEGANMMRDGQLKIPEDVVIVWPDDGSGIIRDQGTVQANQGIYYHTAMMNGNANQLTEAVNPARIYREISRFIRAGATEFFLDNLSDVRPVPLSTDCAMRFVWNAEPQLDKPDDENMKHFLADWSQRQFGEAISDEVATVYSRYFNIPYHREEVRKGEHRLQTFLRGTTSKSLEFVAENKPISEKMYAQVHDVRKYARGSLGYVTELAQSATPLAERVPPGRRDFYQSHVLTPIQFHQSSLEAMDYLSTALINYQEGDKELAIANTRKALEANGRVFDALHRAETVKWAGWYEGDCFTDVQASRGELRRLLAALKGNPPPLIRPRFNYRVLYKYQERFSENFPLMYEK